MSNTPEDTKHLNSVPASQTAAESNAEPDAATASTDDSGVKPKPKSYLPKFPFRFKGKNTIIRGSGNQGGSGAVKSGSSR